MRSHRPVSLLIVLETESLPPGLDAALEREKFFFKTCTPKEAITSIGDPPHGTFDAILAIASTLDAWCFDLVARLRAAGDATPLLALCEVVTAAERIQCLRDGADDLQIAPWDLEEISVRLAAIVRRSREIPILRYNDLTLDLGRREVHLAGAAIDVSPKEFDLLRVLAEARGQVCSRAELLLAVWGRDKDPGTAVVEVLVARLRRKLERGQKTLIRTSHGRGYFIAGPEEALAE